MSRILIIEDEEAIADLEKDYLELSGFDVEIETRGDRGLTAAMQKDFDLIILDLMLPGIDGFDVCRKIREKKDIPILMVSAKKDDIDKIRGLGLGADDYISKPCSLEELALRIGINIRKNRRSQNSLDELDVPPLRILPLKRKVFCMDQEVLLSNREYELLLLFARNPNRTLTFEEVGKTINGTYLQSDRQAVMMTASRLRKKLEQYAGVTGMIETVWGEGYRLKK